MNALTVDLGFQPRPHQRAAWALMLVARFVVLVWHRRAGKTLFSLCKLVLAALACALPRGRFGYVAPELKQAKRVAWDYLKDFARRVPGHVINESELWVRFPNGAEIRLFGADDPDSLRGGYFDGVVVDECADMKPNVWGEVIRPQLADRKGWAIFIGTPKGINLFSEMYHYATRGEDGWAADLKRAADTGAIDAEELASAKRSMTDAQFAQEFDCDFAAAVDNALLPLNVVLEAQRRGIAEKDYDFAPRVLGIDVARQGSANSVFFPRQGLVAFQPEIYKTDDSMALAGHAARLLDKWQPEVVFVDGSPVSSGLIDRLRQLGHKNIVEVFFGGTALNPRHDNRRTEMWWEMAAWVKGGGCLPAGERLTRELSTPLYAYANKRGKLELESKEEMQRRTHLPSPDLADALALTFAAPVKIKTELDRAREVQRVRGWDYDPREIGAA